MTLTDRLGMFILGCAIGAIGGYFVGRWRTSKKGMDEPKTMSRTDLVQALALLLVVGLTVYAAFSSQSAANGVNRNQGRIFRIATCNGAYLSSTIDALNERTTFTTQQAKTTADLQSDQAKLITILLVRPEVPKSQRDKALQTYLDSLQEFNVVRAKALKKVQTNPYPDAGGLAECINNGLTRPEGLPTS